MCLVLLAASCAHGDHQTGSRNGVSIPDVSQRLSLLKADRIWNELEQSFGAPINRGELGQCVFPSFDTRVPDVFGDYRQRGAVVDIGRILASSGWVVDQEGVIQESPPTQYVRAHKSFGTWTSSATVDIDKVEVSVALDALSESECR